MLDLFGAEACLEAAADYGDCGGRGAVFPYGLLYLKGGLHVLRVGHSVRYDGGFKRHYWLVCSERRLNFR